MRRKGRNKGHGNRYEEGYGSLQHKRRYHKYTTHILVRSFSRPPQSQNLSLRLRCVFSFVLRLSLVSLRCVCVVSASYLRLVLIHQGFISFLSRPRPLSIEIATREFSTTV